MAAKHVEISDPAAKNLVDNVVELGFVEKVEDPVVLTSPFFPSKIGGKPAWLALTGLPSQILCKNCEKPMVFLLQVYVPSEDEKSSSYHRTVFVFCCRNGACYTLNCNKCFTAFRCQITRENEFYPTDLSFQEQDKIFQEFKDRKAGVGSGWTKLCKVCGCRGEKLCGKCHGEHYCSKEHQAVDWKTGHKLVCGTGGQNTNKAGRW
jgi:pre-rRNA-processing protein TSR4